MKSGHRRLNDRDESRENRRERERNNLRRQQRVRELINSKACFFVMLFISFIIFCVFCSILPDGIGNRSEEFKNSVLMDYNEYILHKKQSEKVL